MSGTTFEMREIHSPKPNIPILNRTKLLVMPLAAGAFVLVLFLTTSWLKLSQESASGTRWLTDWSSFEGALLGLLPLVSVAMAVYFTRRNRALIAQRYEGTLAQIHNRALAYQKSYSSTIMAMLLIGLGIAVIINFLSFFLIANREVLETLRITSIGSILFSLIIFNSIVLPVFGKTRIAVIAVAAVITGILIAMPLAAANGWNISLGFLTGSLLGCLIGGVATRGSFINVEHNLFRVLMYSQGC